MFNLRVLSGLVEMGESCKDCSKWAEDIYWAHFQTIQFSQPLLDDFDQELVSIMFTLSLFWVCHFQSIWKPLHSLGIVGFVTFTVYLSVSLSD